MDNNTVLEKSGLGRRIGAFLIDHFIICFIAMIPFILKFNDILENPDMIFSLISSILIIAFIAYLLKDIFFGFSLGKWIFGIKVVDITDPGKTPSFYKLILRNFFIFIWPIEFFVLLLGSDKRRLGDKIAQTDVYLVKNKMSVLRIIILVMFIFAIFASTLIISVIQIIKNDSSYKEAVIYIESQNEIQADVGGIIGYGSFPMGSVSIQNGNGQAEFSIKVRGKSKNITIHIQLEKQPGRDWRVIKLNY